MAGTIGPRVDADAAVLFGGRLGTLANGPAHDQEETHDRDLQGEHQPDEGPAIHSVSDVTTDPLVDAREGGRYSFPSR
jgi:hypothetical protein